MKITTIWVYPIKGIRGMNLQHAQLGPQGVKYDRQFILCRVEDSGELKKMQLSHFPECSLFSQEIHGEFLHVQYLTPKQPIAPARSEQNEILKVPLEPDLSDLERAVLNVHQSMVHAYHMGSPYDEWFSACFGFRVRLLYIGEERRPVLGTFSPRNDPILPISSKSWFAIAWSYIWPTQTGPEPDWLTFSDHAPYLVASEQSLLNVSGRLATGPVDMLKFRPNIVVDGEAEFSEDFWTELSIKGRPAFTLTKLCNRCSSLNVDYETGKVAEGEHGQILKKLMSDRRVDAGFKWAPCFGKYAFLADGMDRFTLSVGDEIVVSKRSPERPMYDWPIRSKEHARFYHYS